MKTIAPFIYSLLSYMLISGCNPKSTELQKDIITETYPEEQSRIEKLIPEIFDVAISKDIDRLEGYHLYGDKYINIYTNYHLLGFVIF